MWAVLTSAERETGWDVAEFLSTGEAEVDALLARIDELGGVPRGHALDFGCGVGRCTRYLAQHFEHVVGVDIAPSMIERARDLAGDVPNMSFEAHARPDLGLFADGSFDLVYSNIVLQHMEVRYGMRYVAEFVRVLRPNGLAVFQVPTAYPTPAGGKLAIAKYQARKHAPESVLRLYDAVNRRLRPTGMPAMEMHVYAVPDIVDLVTGRGGAVISTDRDGSLDTEWESVRMIVRRGDT